MERGGCGFESQRAATERDVRRTHRPTSHTEDAYAELSNLLNPTSWSEITFWWRSLSTVARKGFVATKRVLVSGQYSVPGALWYGGTELQKSHKHVLKFLGKAVPCVEINQCIGCMQKQEVVEGSECLGTG